MKDRNSSYSHLLLPLLILLGGLILLPGCRRHSEIDERLEQIAALIDEKPGEAIAALDSIEPGSLSKSDRHYRDLLRIKAADKDYIEHTSDSLILDVISFYEKHGDNALYSEALYYGGRVYSDLGDYPTSISYFRQALETLPEKEGNQNLRASILSQTGRLLATMRMYEEAVTYIEETIELDKELGDTLNLIYDIQLLGDVYSMARDYDKAEQIYKETLKYSDNITPGQIALTKINLSTINRRRGNLDSSLYYVRNVVSEVNRMSINSAMHETAAVYLEAGMLDSAYYYAKKIVESEDPERKDLAYSILLSPELKDYVSADSLYKYVKAYNRLLSRRYDNNQTQLFLNRQNYYNYRLHVREREKAELERAKVWDWLLFSAVVILLLVIIILYTAYRAKQQRLRLHIAIDTIEKLRRDIEESNTPERTSEKFIGLDNDKEIKKRLKDDLLRLYEEHRDDQPGIEIIKSEAYHKLQQRIERNEILPEKDSLWKELEETVLRVSPYFKERFELLLGSRPSQSEFHTALLLKCGVSPTKMSNLVGRSKSAIVSRRKTIGVKIFDKKMEPQVIDTIIRLL